MKKLAAIILTLTLTASLTACNGQGSDAQPTSQNNTSSKTTKVNGKEYTFSEVKGKYTGDWENDMPNGKGQFISDKISYNGEWNNGAPNGRGEIFLEDETNTIYYNGELFNGHMQGEGYYKYITVESEIDYIYEYRGKFMNDMMDGKGILKIGSDKADYFEIFDGEFKSGDIYGKATYQKYQDGKLTESGIYENGKYKSDADIMVDNAIDSALRYFADKEGLGDFYDSISSYFFD